jgi:hypothetical protein
MASQTNQRSRWFARLYRMRARAGELAASGHMGDCEAVRLALVWEGFGERELGSALRGDLIQRWLRALIHKHQDHKRFDA